MNILVDTLPNTVKIGNYIIPIHTDFRTGILFEEAVYDDSLTQEEKLLTLLELYYPFKEHITGELLEEAVQKVIWFHGCGKVSDQSTPPDLGGTAEPSFSFEYDADYIYSGFMQAYGIDLIQKNLHWWQFNALFKSLPEDTQIVKIIGYRTMKIPEKASKEQKEHYRKMKKLYALPDSYKHAQMESDLTEILMKGGNPENVLRRQ